MAFLNISKRGKTPKVAFVIFVEEEALDLIK
jgi:hypothetical protein